MRYLLIGQLKRKGLWLESPRLLGLPYNQWTESGAVEELVHDAYGEALLAPAKALQALLSAGSPSVDAAVTRNLGHFLYRLHRGLDPLGHGIFLLTRRVFEKVAEGSAKLSPPGEVSRGSRLVFDPGGRRPAPEGLLEERATTWGYDLMPELLTARHGSPKQELLERLAERLRASSELGALPFEEIVAGLGRGARNYLDSVLHRPQDNPVEELVELRVEAADGRRHVALVECVDRAVPTLMPTAKTRRHLEGLWTFVQQWSLDENQGPRFPSRRRLALILDIPRPTLAKLFDALAAQLSDCLRVVNHGTSFRPATPS